MIYTNKDDLKTVHIIAVSPSHQLLVSGQSCLGFGCFLYSYLATIVSALKAYGMVNIQCAAVRANGQCRRYSLIVGSAL